MNVPASASSSPINILNKVVIAILDLDHFKSVNDSFGHMVGDKVLARAGRRLKEIVGTDGVVGRIGGDEFMIVFTGLNDDLALRSMLRAIRTQIKWEFAEDFEGLSITCSIGASIFPTNGTDYDDNVRTLINENERLAEAMKPLKQEESNNA